MGKHFFTMKKNLGGKVCDRDHKYSLQAEMMVIIRIVFHDPDSINRAGPLENDPICFFI